VAIFLKIKLIYYKWFVVFMDFIYTG